MNKWLKEWCIHIFSVNVEIYRNFACDCFYANFAVTQYALRFKEKYVDDVNLVLYKCTLMST